MTNKKNIIFLLIDGARYDFMTKDIFYLKLLKESRLYTKVYTTTPYTIGSMHAMFTSLYPKNNGVNGYLRPNRLKESAKTMPQHLKDSGYFTLCNIPSPVVMSDRGFDAYETHDEYLFRNAEDHKESLKKHEKRIKESKNYFIYFHYSHIHTSLSNRVLKKYDDFSDEYFTGIEENKKIHKKDVELSGTYAEEMLDFIEKNGFDENTDIWIASDHGVSVGDRVGEKAYGVYLFDYTLHTFLIKCKCGFSQENSFRGVIDTMPLIFRDAGIDVPDNIDGKIERKRIVKSIFSRKEVSEPLFLETGGVGGPFPSPEKHNIFGVMNEKRKLIHNRTIDSFEEYEYKDGEDTLLKKVDSKLKRILLDYERE